MNLGKKINFLDLLLLLTIVFSITGYILARAEKTGLNKVIKGKEKIAIEVLLSDVFSKEHEKEQDAFFKIGEKVAITIRNRPYSKLEVVKIERRPKTAIVFNSQGAYKAIADPTKIDLNDYIITLTDTALRTNDGYVISGNKIKAGNLIELEGFNYRLNGKVINVYPINSF